MNALVDIIRKYARPVVAAAAIGIGFSGCAQKTYQKENTSARSQDNSQKPLSLEEEARIYNAASAKLQAIYALRDGPDADSPELLKKQVDLATEAINLTERVKPIHYDNRTWQMNVESALQLRGNTWCALGKYEQAIADYNKWLLITDYSADTILNQRGLARREQGDANGALIDFLLSAGLSKDSVAFRNRAHTLVRLGRLEEALEDCNKALSREPGNSYNLMLKARIYRLMGDPILAFAEAARAVDWAPNNINAYIEYALAAIALSNKPGGYGPLDFLINKLDKAIKLKPDMHELYGLRATANFIEKNYEAAASDFTKARELIGKQKKPAPVQPIAGGEFNVLEYAVWDESNKRLILAGKNDPQYPSTAIPYYDLLQTALAHPDPGFSLDVTQESRSRVEALLDRFEKGDKNLFDEAGSGVLKQSLANLLSILTAYLPDKNGGIVPADHKNDYDSSPLFWDIADTFGIRGDLETILAGKGTQEVHRRALTKLTGMPNLYEEIHEMYAKKDDAERERLTERMRNSFAKNWANQEFFIGPAFAKNLFGETLIARLRFDNLSDDTQLSRIVFEADYALKYVVSTPISVSNHKTHSNWILENRAEIERKWTRFWISPQKISIATSQDGNAFEFREAKLQINAMDEVEGRDFADPVTLSYAQFLTKNYDLYAKKFAPLHEIREASKILALAKILRSKKMIPLGLPPQQKWKSPGEVEGMTVYYKTNTNYGIMSANGGVDLRKIEQKTELYKTPTVPRLDELEMNSRRGYTGSDFILKVNKKPLIAIVPEGTSIPGTKEEAVRRVERLEKMVSESRSHIEDLNNGVQINKRALDGMVEQQYALADEWRLAAGELLLGTSANAQSMRDTKQATSPLNKINKYADFSTASQTFSALMFAKTMNENLKNKDFAEAATEGTLYLADVSLDAFNSIMSNPEIRNDAAKWMGSGGQVINAYNFTRGAIDSINAAHQFADHLRDSNEMLRSIDDATKLQKTLGEIHKKRVDELTKAKQELKKFGSDK